MATLTRERPQQQTGRRAQSKDQGQKQSVKKSKLNEPTPTTEKETNLVGTFGMALSIAAGSAFLGAAFGTAYAIVGGVLGLGLGLYQEVRTVK